MMMRTRVWRRGRKLGGEGREGLVREMLITMIPNVERGAVDANIKELKIHVKIDPLGEFTKDFMTRLHYHCQR